VPIFIIRRYQHLYKTACDVEGKSFKACPESLKSTYEQWRSEGMAKYAYTRSANCEGVQNCASKLVPIFILPSTKSLFPRFVRGANESSYAIVYEYMVIKFVLKTI